MRVFLVDDEQLALKRLTRLLSASAHVEVVGSSQDPEDAIEAIEKTKPDLLFLDIEMPGMSGFELLAKLQAQPLVVFTTAYDRYALEAFGVNSVDYLLKPIEAAQLDRALRKIETLRGSGLDARLEVRALLSQLSSAAKQTPAYPQRIASRLGERTEFIDLGRISHFYADEKLTFAATEAKNFIVDHSIQELEKRLDPKAFVRIHRATLLNVSYVFEMYPLFAGRMMVRLKDAKRTELTVARDRVRILKDKLGI